MVTFFQYIATVCLGIWGIHILFQEGHLLERPGNWMRDRSPEPWWIKPLFDCPICMSSVWGIVGFFAVDYFFDLHMPYRQIVPFVFCLCGLNTILGKLTTKERIIVDE